EAIEATLDQVALRGRIDHVSQRQASGVLCDGNANHDGPLRGSGREPLPALSLARAGAGCNSPCFSFQNSVWERTDWKLRFPYQGAHAAQALFARNGVSRHIAFQTEFGNEGTGAWERENGDHCN